jgi:hypothetical protein
MGWFIVAGAVLAALAHHLAYSAMKPGSSQG